MTCGIYQIVNMINGHIYIGSAVNFRMRKNEHWRRARKGIHHSTYFQLAWNKYGESSFEFEPLIECPVDLLAYYEQQFIDLGKPEYNMSIDVIAPMLGRTHTVEARAKIGEIAHNLSDENRQKKHDDMVGNQHALGYHHTDDAKHRMSISRMGNINGHGSKGKTRRPHTDETKRKCGLANIGNKYWLGRKHTDESKEKMRISRLAFVEKQRKQMED